MTCFRIVNAESLVRQISGNGGTMGFRARLAVVKGRQELICLSSSFTNSKGELMSRIVPGFTPGTTTTIPRQMVDYIVTEYGAVKLPACPTWMRAEKIISIAHPNFRDDLIKEAEKMKIWRRSNKLPV